MPSSYPVVIVEDDADTRSALIEWFRIEGIEVVGLSDAESLVALWESGLVASVLVLDLGLPGLSGAQFLRETLANPERSGVPVVVITGRPVAAGEFAGTGVRKVIQKPFDPEELVACVRTLLAAGPGRP